MDKSFFKPLNIRRRVFQVISRKGKFGDRAHTLMSGQVLPAFMFVGLHVFQALEFADFLVHVLICNTAFHLPDPISVLARETNRFVSNTASNPPATTSNPRQNPGHQIGTPGFLMNL